MFIIYSDGACSNNPGPGAWAYKVFKNNKEVSYACGAEEMTTNNRMELMAAIKALEAFADKECKMIVDSQYLKNGINVWIKKWKVNGWKSASGAVKNKDLWEQLDKLVENKNIEWEWQKGHANSTHDEVDLLARNCCKNFQGQF